PRPSRSGGGAVALFVFLAGAAGAGVVAADFSGGADGFGRLGLRGAGLELKILLLAALALLDLLRFRFGFGRLHEEEEANRFGVDAVHHLFEKGERFLLELDQRVLLSISAKADAFLQMVEGEEVILPLRIDDIEQDA